VVGFMLVQSGIAVCSDRRSSVRSAWPTIPAATRVLPPYPLAHGGDTIDEFGLAHGPHFNGPTIAIHKARLHKHSSHMVRPIGIETLEISNGKLASVH